MGGRLHGLSLRWLSPFLGVSLGTASEAISMRLFEFALLWAVYPGNCGSSGTVARKPSNARLKVSVEQPVLFRMSLGRQLKRRGP